MVDGVAPKDAIVKNELKYLDVLPSHIDLVGAEIEMVNIERRKKKCEKRLKELRMIMILSSLTAPLPSD
jgi:chromosome partitioning protein